MAAKARGVVAAVVEKGADIGKLAAAGGIWYEAGSVRSAAIPEGEVTGGAGVTEELLAKMAFEGLGGLHEDKQGLPRTKSIAGPAAGLRWI